MSRMPVAARRKPKLGGEGHFSYKSWNMAVSKPLASQAERTAINRLPLHVVTALSNTKAGCSNQLPVVEPGKRASIVSVRC